MPDLISLPNAATTGHYDLEANACVALPPAAPPAATPPAQTIVLPEVVVSAGAQQLIDGYAQGGRTSSGEAAKRAECGLETVRAAITCGQTLATLLATTPTVVGAVVSGLVGGMACGLASAEAYACYSQKP